MFPAVITALAFIITFIVVGLVVVAAAFSGGRRQSARPPGPTRRNRRFVGIGVGLVVLLLGVLVPALVIASAKDSNTAPGGVKLTTAEERGRNIFAERCATCHTLAAAHAVGKVGPNLDQLVGGLDPKGQKPFILSAIKQGRAQGRGQMPAGLVDGQDAQDVAAFVAAVAGH
jgi:mono/diheme cytochrome c family protein